MNALFFKERKRSRQCGTCSDREQYRMSFHLKIMVEEPENIIDHDVDSLSPSSTMMRRNNLIEMKFVL